MSNFGNRSGQLNQAAQGNQGDFVMKDVGIYFAETSIRDAHDDGFYGWSTSEEGLTALFAKYIRDQRWNAITHLLDKKKECDPDKLSDDEVVNTYVAHASEHEIEYVDRWDTYPTRFPAVGNIIGKTEPDDVWLDQSKAPERYAIMDSTGSPIAVYTPTADPEDQGPVFWQYLVYGQTHGAEALREHIYRKISDQTALFADAIKDGKGASSAS